MEIIYPNSKEHSFKEEGPGHYSLKNPSDSTVISIELSHGVNMQISRPTREKIGGAALLERVSKYDIATPESPKTYGDLFPAAFLASQGHDNNVNAKEAHSLLEELGDEHPYHDFAISELALRQLEQGHVQYAYESFKKLGTNPLAVHLLSQILTYEDEQHRQVLDREKATAELHKLAIDSYDTDGTTLAASALVEASEILEDDNELRIYAKVAMLEHPEIPQAATFESLYVDPDENLKPIE